MAKATDLKVQIKFEATGDKELARAFTKAATAQKKLEDVTKRLSKAEKKLGKRTNMLGLSFTRLTGKAGKMRLSLATLRSQLLVLTFGFNLINRTFGASVRAFMQQEDAVAKLNSTLRSTKGAAKVSSRELQGLASQMQKLTGIGDETILSMQGVLLTFTQIKGDVFKDATKAILDISVALGQDLQQTAIQVGKALNDPKLGVSALSRVGIQFTDTQKAMIKQFVKSNEVAKAQSIILKELELQFGGTAENVDSTSMSFKRLTSAFGDLMESGGGKLAPFIKSVVDLGTAAIETVNDTEDSGFNEFFSNISQESRGAIAGINLLETALDSKILTIMKEIGFAEDDLDLRKFFNKENEARVIAFGDSILNNPGNAINELNESLRELEGTPTTFFDDVVDILQLFPDINPEEVLRQSGAFGFEDIMNKFPAHIKEFTNDAAQPAITEMRNYFNKIIEDGKITPDEINQKFNDLGFAANVAIAINSQMSEFGDTSQFADISPFADILETIFGADVSFNENQETIDFIKNFREQIRLYAEEAGIPLPDDKTPLQKMVEGMVKFKEEHTDTIKGFDDLSAAAMQFSKGNKEVTIGLLKMRQALAIGNMILAFTEFMANREYGKAFSAFAAGMTKVAQFKSQIDAAKSAALGADFIAGSPQYIKVGDNPQMRERVTVTPLGSPNVRGGGSASGVVINLNGNILGTEEFVRDTLIPQLENSLGRNLA